MQVNPRFQPIPPSSSRLALDVARKLVPVLPAITDGRYSLARAAALVQSVMTGAGTTSELAYEIAGRLEHVLTKEATLECLSLADIAGLVQDEIEHPTIYREAGGGRF